MIINLQITGKTPLMMHNERLANSEDEYVRQIKEITSKGKDQTDNDRNLVSKLEWRGGLYVDEKGVIVLPTPNLVRCLREAATITKKGKAVARGLIPHELQMPLFIAGESRKFSELSSKPEYYDRRSVGIGRKRVTRTRPIFHAWSAAAQFEMLDDVLNLSSIVSIADLAGRAVGLCDARILGYGRFEAKISKA